ncbi:MAG: ABC transporter ATP-binding protein/permease [Christensenellaceae bacterium]|jgi:ATP-binding cassette subfamily B protein|nr:ABC transporter ATP-binding protein/permease [Christensenellaceae bacterium]
MKKSFGAKNNNINLAKKRINSQTALRVLKRLVRYIFEAFPFQSVIILFTTLISVGANASGTFMLKEIVESILNVRKGNAEISTVLISIAILICIYLVGVIGTFTTQRLALNISAGIMRTMRDQMFKHVQYLPVQYFASHVHGETMNSFSNDTDSLREMLSQGLPQMISSTLMVIGLLTTMLILSPVLTTLVIGMLILMLFVSSFITKNGRKYFIAQQRDLAKVNGYIEEYVEGQKIVNIFCHENTTKKSFDELTEALRKSALSAQSFSNIIMPILNNMSFISYVLTAVVGVILVVNGALGTDLEKGIAIMIAFLPASKQFSMPISQFAQQFNSILTALAGAERIFNILDTHLEHDEGYVTLVNIEENEKGEFIETLDKTNRWAWRHPHHDGSLTYTELKGDVRFESVTFSYDGERNVLNNISLYAKPGQKIAFVGSTGAGKTTITNLINRFYDVPDGKIRYDGININKIKKTDLRRSLAMVLQDTHLFTGTVSDNIRYGRLDATDEDVKKAAKLANADFFISHLPNGYDTWLTSDGANLSQGQRQLINIARAAVADPPVLILDEATSSVDTRTEKLIEAGMDRLMHGRTVFIIAHRLSTIKNANVILVLENGEIIERGNHETLLEQHGRYYELYTGLFELS